MRNKSERGSSYMSFLRRRLLQKNAESPKNSAKASPPSLQRPSAGHVLSLSNGRPSGNNPENCNPWQAGTYCHRRA